MFSYYICLFFQCSAWLSLAQHSFDDFLRPLHWSPLNCLLFWVESVVKVRRIIVQILLKFFIRFLKADSKKRKPFPLHWKIWFPQANCCDDIGHDITRLLLLLVGWLLSFMPQEVSVYYIWKMSTCETNQTTTYHIVGQIMS